VSELVNLLLFVLQQGEKLDGFKSTGKVNLRTTKLITRLNRSRAVIGREQGK